MMTELNIKLTPRAVDHIKQKLQAEKGYGLRLTIKKTGCSGYAYAPMIVTEAIPTGDFVVQQAGISIYVDPLWAHVLQDIEVDFVVDKATGLQQKKLVFLNPNETARCGCGESFHIEASS